MDTETTNHRFPTQPTDASCIFIDVLSKIDPCADCRHQETQSLISTLGIKINVEFIQYKPSPDKKTFVGAGKITEIRDYTRTNHTNLIIFGKNLSPSQNKHIETYLNTAVWDRTRLILEIFYQHAKTFESKLQVKLAQYQYQLPRLKGMWTHLDRESGAGLNKGMGEKQITMDRFLLKKKISQLKTELKKINNKRIVQKKGRRNVIKVSLIGYTNAGKSKLFNVMTGANVLSEDILFATLDSKSGVTATHHTPPIIVSDTVGFIRDLPPDLVASFRSTLNSLADSDLLLHVIDSSSEDIEGNIQTTLSVLKDIHAVDIPVVNIFNKIDLLNDVDLFALKSNYPRALFVSCERESTGSLVFNRLKTHFSSESIKKTMLIPYSESKIIGDYYKYAMVRKITYTADGIELTADVPKENMAKFGQNQTYAVATSSNSA